MMESQLWVSGGPQLRMFGGKREWKDAMSGFYYVRSLV
jgi:hypothetical protein